MWMMEYGCPFDLRELPDPMFQAHLALLRGLNEKRREQAEEAEGVEGSGKRYG